MQLTELQNIDSSSADFGIRTMLSANGSILAIISDVTANTANVDVYKYDFNVNRFNYYDSSLIDLSAEISGNSVINFSGDFFITSSLQQKNAKCQIFKINTTDKKNKTVYKINDFSVANIDYATRVLKFSGTSEYLTLCSFSSFSIFKYDSAVKNFALVETIATGKNITGHMPVAVMTENGDGGLYISSEIQNDVTKFSLSTINATDATHTKYTISNKMITDEITQDIYDDVIKYFNLVRSNNSVYFNINKKKYVEIVKTNNVYDFKYKKSSLGGYTAYEKINFNSGLAVRNSVQFVVDRATIQTSNNETHLQIDDSQTFDSAHFYRRGKDYESAISDTGVVALPIGRSATAKNAVRIYRDVNYPAFYKPVSYPNLTMPDLITPPIEPIVDSHKFIVTYTYRR